MQTIDNIVPDQGIYPFARHWTVLLYHMDGTHIAIPLPNAHLMSFIQVFRRATECRNHIITNRQKDITLFTYEDNMQWLIDNNYLRNIPQVQKINIFCSSLDAQQYWTTWTGRYRERFEEPFLYDKLDYKLLLFGYNHIEKLCQQFSDDNAVKTRLKEDLREISRALATYFLERANIENDRIRQSEEAHR